MALLKDGSYVVTPDNGSLTHLLHQVGIEEICEIDEKVNRYHGPEEVSVFHGRDLFGYCAAKLAAGITDSPVIMKSTVRFIFYILQIKLGLFFVVAVTPVILKPQ